MNNYKIEFNKLTWESINPGAWQKVYQTEDNILRQLRLNDLFIEKDWCTKGHQGIVLSGNFKLKFEHKSVSFDIGDIIQIPSGIEHKHKAIIDQGQEVILFLVESNGSA